MSKGTSAQNVGRVKQARDRLKKFLRALDKVPIEELRRTAPRIYDEAIAQTPYETGALEESVFVRVSKYAGEYTLKAGASATSPRGYDYAGIQHENTAFNHPIKGKAYYISDPFNHQVALMKRRIRRRLKRSK